MKNLKYVIDTILSILFPYNEPNYRVSVFIQNTWLEKVMQPTQLKDYLWTPPFKNK